MYGTLECTFELKVAVLYITLSRIHFVLKTYIAPSSVHFELKMTISYTALSRVRFELKMVHHAIYTIIICTDNS